MEPHIVMAQRVLGLASKAVAVHRDLSSLQDKYNSRRAALDGLRNEFVSFDAALLYLHDILSRAGPTLSGRFRCKPDLLPSSNAALVGSDMVLACLEHEVASLSRAWLLHQNRDWDSRASDYWLKDVMDLFHQYLRRMTDGLEALRRALEAESIVELDCMLDDLRDVASRIVDNIGTLRKAYPYNPVMPMDAEFVELDENDDGVAIQASMSSGSSVEDRGSESAAGSVAEDVHSIDTSGVHSAAASHGNTEAGYASSIESEIPLLQRTSAYFHIRTQRYYTPSSPSSTSGGFDPSHIRAGEDHKFSNSGRHGNKSAEAAIQPMVNSVTTHEVDVVHDNEGQGDLVVQEENTLHDEVANMHTFGVYTLGAVVSHPQDLSVVRLGRASAQSPLVAIKIIHRPTGRLVNRVDRQVAFLRNSYLAHPKLPRLLETLETDRHMAFVLDPIEGGELDRFLLDMGHLDEDVAQDIFSQVASAIAFLHFRGFGHFNLHVGHILINNRGDVELCGFGNACSFDQYKRDADLRSYCDVYSPPELALSCFQHQYADKIDVWGCGIILYAMLAGKLPWDRPAPDVDTYDYVRCLYADIQSQPLTFPCHVEAAAQQFIESMLAIEPHQRLDMFEVASHEWLGEYSRDYSYMLPPPDHGGDELPQLVQ